MEVVLFYIAATVSLSATTLVISRSNASHALIYLIVSLLSIAVIFYLLGAPFAAALEIVIYAGAIMVLFLFVVMMLNLGKSAVDQEHAWLNGRMWIGPSILTFILFLELWSQMSSIVVIQQLQGLAETVL
jgi:NADH-quinone oxidoreductase subunit J